jgi:hypothetical protein
MNEAEAMRKLSSERRSLHCELRDIEERALEEAWLPIMRRHPLALLAVALNEVDDSVGDAVVDATSNIEVKAIFELAETPPRGSDLILRYVRAYISTIDPIDDCYESLAAAVDAYLDEREKSAATEGPLAA